MKYFITTKEITMKLSALLPIMAMVSGVLHAQTVAVEGAWVRATVPAQTGTGAFMRLTAQTPAQLVAVSSPAAGVVQVHEMSMQGDVMQMRAISALDLPAGKTVELKPGGYHLMLMDLKQTLVKGSTVPVTLVFQDPKGGKSQQVLAVPVR